MQNVLHEINLMAPASDGNSCDAGGEPRTRTDETRIGDKSMASILPSMEIIRVTNIQNLCTTRRFLTGARRGSRAWQNARPDFQHSAISAPSCLVFFNSGLLGRSPRWVSSVAHSCRTWRHGGSKSSHFTQFAHPLRLARLSPP